MDNAVPTLSLGEAKALEKIQGFFASGATKCEEEVPSMEATPPPALSGMVILSCSDLSSLVSDSRSMVLQQV